MTIEISGILLLSLLLTRELVGAVDSNRAQLLATFLVVPIISLLILFVFIVISTAIELVS